MGPARKHCGVWYQVDLVLESTLVEHLTHGPLLACGAES